VIRRDSARDKKYLLDTGLTRSVLPQGKPASETDAGAEEEIKAKEDSAYPSRVGKNMDLQVITQTRLKNRLALKTLINTGKLPQNGGAGLASIRQGRRKSGTARKLHYDARGGKPERRRKD